MIVDEYTRDDPIVPIPIPDLDAYDFVLDQFLGAPSGDIREGLSSFRSVDTVKPDANGFFVTHHFDRVAVFHTDALSLERSVADPPVLAPRKGKRQ